MAPKLTCHPAVFAELQALYPPPLDVLMPGLPDVSRLAGIDVMPDPSMRVGEWKLTDDDQLVSWCFPADNGTSIIYTPGGR